MHKETSSFDRAIWRINGILILGVFIAAAIVTLFSDHNIFRQDVYGAPSRGSIPVTGEGKSSAAEQLYLGQFRETGGGQYSSAPLYSDSERRKARYPRSSSTIRNYYYYDSETSAGNWLFDSNNYLITDRQTLREGHYRRGDGGKVYGYLYTVVDGDSDNDGHLTERDKSALYISNAGGKETRKILDGIETILGTEILSNGKLVLFTQENGGDFVYQIDLQSLEVSSKTKVEYAKK